MSQTNEPKAPKLVVPQMRIKAHAEKINFEVLDERTNNTLFRTAYETLDFEVDVVGLMEALPALHQHAKDMANAQGWTL